MIVVDASALIELLLLTKDAVTVAERLFEAGSHRAAGRDAELELL